MPAPGGIALALAAMAQVLVVLEPLVAAELYLELAPAEEMAQGSWAGVSATTSTP